MRRLPLVWLLLAVAFAGLACGDDGGEESDDALGTATTATNAGDTTVPTTSPGTTLAPTSLTLRITDVRLVYSEEPDRGMRVVLPPGVTAASVILGGLPSPNGLIAVCQAPGLEGDFNSASCRTPNGEGAVSVTMSGTARGVEIVQDVPAPGDEPVTVQEVTIRYSASSREVDVRLPQIAAGDDPVRPTFGLTPPSADGRYRATLSWTVIPVFGGTPSSGQLELLQGGNVADQAQGGGEARLEGTVPQPGTEATLRAQNLGSSALVTPRLNALLP